MVRKYIRKTDKAKWTTEDLKKAKQSVAEGLSVRKAAQVFKIPFSTLQIRLKSGTDSHPSLGRKCDFPPAHEEALADHVKTLSNIFFGMTATMVRKIAFEYAEENHLNHRFNKETKMAGLDWMYGFMARHKICIRCRPRSSKRKNSERRDECPKKQKCTLSIDQDGLLESTRFESKGEQRTSEQTSDGDCPEPRITFTPKQPPPKKQKETDPVTIQNDLLKLACDLLSTSCKQETNEGLDIAKVWGTKLMSLDPMQRKFAEKAINDVLFEADLGTLRRSSVQINSSHDSALLESP